MKIRDVVAIGLLAVPLTGFALASIRRADEMDNRIRCASNLRQLGQAMLLYSNLNRGELPRGPVSGDAHPKPVYATPYEGHPELDIAPAKVSPFAPQPKPGAPPAEPNVYAVAENDVTAVLFLLMREQDVSASVFVCPSADQTPLHPDDDAGIVPFLSNFKGRDAVANHLSYSVHNPYYGPDAIGKKASWKSDELSPEFALMADMNPGGDAVVKASVNDDATARRAANSLNHGRVGQNVLFGDGHVDFMSSPLAGVNRDNIYTSASQKIEASAAGEGDSVLLPTASWAGISATEEQLKARTAPPGMKPTILPKRRDPSSQPTTR